MSPIELRVAEASRKTIEALQLQGMSVNQSYGYDAPSLPSDITDQYVAYLEFISLQLWCAEVDRAEADKNLSFIKSQKRLALKKAGTSVSMIDAEIDVDPDYKAKLDALQELSNYRGLIHIISERLSKDISLINREITRRVNINKATVRSSWTTP